MIKEICANVWGLLDSNSAVCILTNNTVCKYYVPEIMQTVVKNIMGGGIAKEAKDRNPGLECICAQSILDNTYSLGTDKISGAEMLRFPTKNEVQYNSALEIVSDSLYRLRDYAINNPEKKIYLPRPGCGLGGLDWETEVKPLCEKYLSNLENITIVSK